MPKYAPPALPAWAEFWATPGSKLANSVACRCNPKPSFNSRVYNAQDRAVKQPTRVGQRAGRGSKFRGHDWGVRAAARGVGLGPRGRKAGARASGWERARVDTFSELRETSPEAVPRGLKRSPARFGRCPAVARRDRGARRVLVRARSSFARTVVSIAGPRSSAVNGIAFSRSRVVPRRMAESNARNPGRGRDTRRNPDFLARCRIRCLPRPGGERARTKRTRGRHRRQLEL